MKKTTALLTIVFLLFFIVGCGDTKVIKGVEYDTCGIINIALDQKNPDIEYKPIWGNIVWGALLFGTIIAPIYFYGFSMFEPVGGKDPTKPIGAK